MHARPVFKNAIVMVTRSVSEQRFRLTPSAERNEIIEYLVAVIARRHNIGVIALTVMSDHYHGIFYDPDANLPRFTAEFHADLARALNWADRRGKGGRLWDGRQTNQLNLNSNEVLLNKLAYVMANPVAAGAVAHGKSWPGVRVCWPSAPKVVRRPRFFREEKGGEVARPKGHRRRKPTREAVQRASETWGELGVTFPEFALFETTRPPGFDEVDEEPLKAKIRKVVREREAQIRAERVASGDTKYVGARRCAATSLDATASTSHELFSMNPTFVGASASDRKAEFEARQAWRVAYKSALARWVAGDYGVEFPAGTYFMLHRYSACVGALEL